MTEGAYVAAKGCAWAQAAISATEEALLCSMSDPRAAGALQDALRALRKAAESMQAQLDLIPGGGA